MSRDFRRRRLPLLAAAVVALAGTLLTVPPGAVAIPNGGVYMRDNDPTGGMGWPTDNGFEPNTFSDVWHSPDIHVPPLVVGGTSNITITLRNDGQSPITGSVSLFYTVQGTTAKWMSDWLYIGTKFAVTVPNGGVNVVIPWVNVPGPGHFCLLARWDSPDDGMTVAETSDTAANTRNNNNIAWHNVDSFKLPPFQLFWWKVRIRDPEPDPRRFNLVVAQPDRPFVGPGRLVLDLGPTLAERWRQAGQQGIGVRPISDTQVEIVDPRRATIQNLLLNPDDQLDAQLGFTAGDAARGGQFQVNVIQTDTRNNSVGGLDLTATVE